MRDRAVLELRDLEHCPNCDGEPKIIAAILEAPVIERCEPQEFARSVREHGVLKDLFPLGTGGDRAAPPLAEAQHCWPCA